MQVLATKAASEVSRLTYALLTPSLFLFDVPPCLPPPPPAELGRAYVVSESKALPICRLAYLFV